MKFEFKNLAHNKEEVGKGHSSTTCVVASLQKITMMNGCMLPCPVCEKVFSLTYPFIFLVILFITGRQCVFLLFS